MNQETYPSRKSPRHRTFDYSKGGVYSVTVCTYERTCLFGAILDGVMILSESGSVVEQEWRKIPRHYDTVILDEFVVMPNHVHGLIAIMGEGQSDQTDMASHVPTRIFGNPSAGTISSIIGNFKAGVTRRIRQQLRNPEIIVWQTRFHDHIIRDEQDLVIHREYIHDNPRQWQFDRDNPDLQSE